MIRVSFRDATRFAFVQQFVNRSNVSFLGVTFHVQTLEIEVAQPVLATLLERIRDGLPVVFPYVGREQHSWIITASTRKELELTSTRVSRFVVPTYARFDADAHRPLYQEFDADGNRLQQLGRQVYPGGYYSWRAPAQHYSAILRQLELWLRLEDARPSLLIEQQPTYRMLHDAFLTALSGASWDDAAACIEHMQQQHMLTADNKVFLEIQLLAQQQRWNDIWSHPDFEQIAYLPMPKAIRGALLTAFHSHVLLRLEQEEQWEEALDAFQRYRSRLGLLLTGRFGLQQAPILHVFAYQAVWDQDVNALEQLRDLSGSEEEKRNLESIQQLLSVEAATAGLLDQKEPEESDGSVLSPLNVESASPSRVFLPFIDTNYDEVVNYAQKLTDLKEKVLLYIQVAFQSGDLSVADDALLYFEELPLEERERLELEYAFVKPSLKHLAEQVQYPLAFATQEKAPASVEPIHTWLDWFKCALQDPSQSDLQQSLERLTIQQDENFWNVENMQALNGLLFNFISEEAPQCNPKEALQALTNCVLQFPGFPQSDSRAIEFYETLFLGSCELLDTNESNGFSLLKLAEAILQQKLQSREQIFRDFSKWCPIDEPIPALEVWVLEMFDLLGEYGLRPELLTPWYRNWLTTLLRLPSHREKFNLATWRLFGEWIVPGSDLMRDLERELTQEVPAETEDPLTALPDGYRIGILTLREAAAQRARQLLLQRNKKLDIRICIEEDLNDQAKSLAQNSDMVVVVTRCITHALTYGINPYLKDKPVYPRSSGSTSIMQAVETRVKEIGLSR